MKIWLPKWMYNNLPLLYVIIGGIFCYMSFMIASETYPNNSVTDIMSIGLSYLLISWGGIIGSMRV